MSVGIEIDFLPVGEGEKCGDAIALRYGNLHGARNEQTVVVVDGGFKASGEALVAHIREYYGTDRVDIVISTHPDQDHVNGLKVVLEEMEVGTLLMHLPWNRSAGIDESKAMHFRSPKIDDKFEANFSAASDLEELARAKGIEIVEPFEGSRTSDGCLEIVGPSESYYEELLGEIADEEKSKAAHLAKHLRALLASAAEKLLPESLHVETLTDAGETSPQNNSSVITLFRVGEHVALLTADAGMPALERAADRLEALGVGAGTLDFVQVPHHGSRRNVGPTVLTRLLGPKGTDVHVGTAFVSASKDAPKHPAKKVANAFLRRGYPVHGTEGQTKRHNRNAPPRSGWSAATAYPMHDAVADDEG